MKKKLPFDRINKCLNQYVSDITQITSVLKYSRMQRLLLMISNTQLLF